ncbi:hypothetical protein [Streptomyces longisporoflavus]|uniref:Uncharacterized protein n=1 Tax=Streptomyces longisporoflavus TaxID=28044 RepID=A0ABW7R324_9ACTN
MRRSLLTRSTRSRTAPARPLAAGLLALAAAGFLGAAAAPAVGAAEAEGKAVSIRQGKPVDAQPGQDWVYPAMIVTNTGSRPLNSEKLVITADHKSHFISNELGISRRDGHEEHLKCDLVSDDRVLVCDSLGLSLKPRQNLVVYPEMGVDAGVEAPDTSVVNFALGSPQLASGKARIDIHD